MNAFFHRLAVLLLCAAALPLSAAPLQLLDARSHPTPLPQGTAVGYLRIVNPNPEPDRLLAAESPLAAAVEIHETRMHDGVMRMRALPQGLVLPARGEAVLAPGGVHLMLLSTARAFALGEQLPVTLVFERAGRITTTLAVVPRAESPPHAHHHH